ncbi:MAG TPA: hypothetical protein DCE42_12405 [Myxococcales bacterium]|nr:hypothetical protein [Deltaproteobacteria bacterium]HAA55554.1 hypothetical protein [Myxococcales bacterium]|tara:strand:+ start:6548 stop:7810 length:1263 start_codon:yes stop_codon:yes gene_type:complete
MNNWKEMMQTRWLRLYFGWMCVCVLLTSCLVTPAPDVRGWACEIDADCVSDGLYCVNGMCRALCKDDLDCQKVLKETCTSPEGEDAKFCLPPCLSGQTRPCYTGPQGTKDVGLCKAGTQTCTAQATWGSCLEQILPKGEQCNEKDDNCDGKVDEGCDCTPGQTRSCYTGTFSSQGKGECKDGTQTCGANGSYGKCQGDVTPTDEICNGKDDDCNGTIDDNIAQVGQSCDISTLKGKCAKGVFECKFGAPSCKQKTFPVREECNALDDDCDGKIDNNPGSAAHTLTRACYSEKAGCVWDSTLLRYNCTTPCKIGAQKCLENQSTWSQSCVGEVTPQVETCNGVDDDCNGSIDDNVTEVGDACTSQGLGVCKDGKKACKAGKLLCETPLPSTDICDGKDNDCNGKVDDGCPTGQSCQQGTCK